MFSRYGLPFIAKCPLFFIEVLSRSTLDLESREIGAMDLVLARVKVMDHVMAKAVIIFEIMCCEGQGLVILFGLVSVIQNLV